MCPARVLATIDTRRFAAWRGGNFVSDFATMDRLNPPELDQAPLLPSGREIDPGIAAGAEPAFAALPLAFLDTEPAPEPAIRSVHLPASGVLDGYVSALVGLEMGVTGPTPLAVAPSDAIMLSLQFARGGDPIGPKGAFGFNTRLTGIRQWTSSFSGAGDCITLFALLTPLGCVQLLEGREIGSRPMPGPTPDRIAAHRPVTPLAGLLDERLTRDLESQVALAEGLEDKLRVFGAWLEARAGAARQHGRAAQRAARAAMRLCEVPRAAMQTLADEQHVSRRQLERDFDRWLGVSPRHLAQVVQVQGVARSVWRGATLAEASAERGFADQSHMSRVVKKLTGVTPRAFIGPPSPGRRAAKLAQGSKAAAISASISAAFRAATGGRTIYLPQASA
jgi:AraC-like DNA-binding protein